MPGDVLAWEEGKRADSSTQGRRGSVEEQGFVMAVSGMLSMETGHRATGGPRQGLMKRLLTESAAVLARL